MTTRLGRTLATTLALLALVTDTASSAEPSRTGQQSFLLRAVFADGRLWLLSDAGEVSSIAVQAQERIEERLPGRGLDLCLLHGRPAVLACETKSCGNWALHRRIDGRWAIDATVGTEGDRFIALSCDGAAASLLTNRRLIVLGDKAQAAVSLSAEMPSGAIAVVHAAPRHVFVGFNAGEFGGELLAITRSSGKVVPIAGTEFQPFWRSLDPVTGIVAEPWNPDCLAVAVGVVHYAARGWIGEVCGQTIRRLYYKALDESAPRPTAEDIVPFETVAFFGLTVAGDALWALGIDGVYRVEADGTARATPLPRFRGVGGISVSFDLPHLVLVLTRVNQRRSVSGSVPLLVPR